LMRRCGAGVRLERLTVSQKRYYRVALWNQVPFGPSGSASPSRRGAAASLPTVEMLTAGRRTLRLGLAQSARRRMSGKPDTLLTSGELFARVWSLIKVMRASAQQIDVKQEKSI